jgi:DNA-binding transcriptional MerR regulator
LRDGFANYVLRLRWLAGFAKLAIRKWAALGEIPMHRNPANGYRLFKRRDLDVFLKKTARPIKVAK